MIGAQLNPWAPAAACPSLGATKHVLCAANPAMTGLAAKKRWMLVEASEAHWLSAGGPGPLTAAGSVHFARFQCSYDSRL